MVDVCGVTGKKDRLPLLFPDHSRMALEELLPHYMDGSNMDGVYKCVQLFQSHGCSGTKKESLTL